MTDKEVNSQFEQKVRDGMFRPVARFLTNIPAAEDRLQDAVCQVWWMYRCYAIERGVILDDAILVRKCRWHACDLARQFVPGGRRRRSQDVLDPRAYRDGKVQVLRIDGALDDQSAEGDRPLQVGLAEEMAASPERKMNSAIDLQQWVGDLVFRDQALLERKMEGFETTQIAHELGTPYGVTYRREKELGQELAQRAGVLIAPRRRRQPTAVSSAGAARFP